MHNDEAPQWNFPAEPFIPPNDPFNDPPSHQPHFPLAPAANPSPDRLLIRLPRASQMVPQPRPPPRRSSRHSAASNMSGPSGSEYHGSNNSMEMDDAPPAPMDPPEPPKETTLTRAGRRVLKKSYVESDGDDIEEVPPAEEEDEEEAPRRSTRTRKPNKLNGFVASDDEDVPPQSGRYETRSRVKTGSASASARGGSASSGDGIQTRRSGRLTRQPPQPRAAPIRRTRSSARQAQEDGDYEGGHGPSSDDAEASFDNAQHTEDEEDLDAEADVDGEGELIEEEEEEETRGYSLRKKAKVNYAIPPPLEEMRPPPAKRPPPRRGASRKGPGWSATGAELDRWMRGAGLGGHPLGDDSDSDHARSPRKPFGVGAGAGSGAVFAGGAGAGSGMLAGDLAAAAGTPSNLGKVGDAALADADPLGVNQNVTFDEVGGLDEHINSLKEMTLLPLLYPEVFQRFSLTPPRGVLFHGPPGTGKTLLARALAASCRSNGRGISFFMRKGADCLSKWVGEAERQLRLLFEEARACQPSIIFFDEIDGLAPVRSSKQDQVHASIVSTLLALMDGMDGRGQVVVIGATNRPDAVDPALRRPGRFDREFYFPLPKLAAREKILGIMTRKWESWDGEEGQENVKGLAKLTKGYGGADLRALCTEAALNAVQRRYPQIYKSADRLLLKPETIDVQLRDFMIAVKKLVPSSARSASSSATPLPSQLVPLLSTPLERLKAVVDKVMPISKKRTALEEAEWEDENPEGSLDRELMMQSMETLRVYRPRVVLHGPVGMGQGYVGAAALHHLEGYHVQSLDLGNLMSDSTRTVEAAIVQLFLEAKRNQPSVIYVPSLVGWCAAVTETSRSTVRAMLDTLAPTDPILLLAVVDGDYLSLPRDVRAWFGPTRDTRVLLSPPTTEERERFFDGLMGDVRRPPNQFPDGVKRRKRVLEELPIAPPLEPRQPTAAELAMQEESDQRTVALLKFRLGPILNELKRKFKRFTKRAEEEWDLSAPVPLEVPPPADPQVVLGPNDVGGGEPHANGLPNGDAPAQPPIIQIEIDGEPQEQMQMQAQAQAYIAHRPQLHDSDLEQIHLNLYKNRYLTPQDFLDDIVKIVHNARVMAHEDLDRMHKAEAMLNAAEVSLLDLDPQMRLECERMAQRERKRRAERRKDREKEKGLANGNANGHSAYAPGTRRSARNNGQHLHMEITDPVAIERRLKRQRSSDGGGDSQGSGSENSEERNAKRSRLTPDDGHDEIDFLGPSRANGVRFADTPDLNETGSTTPRPLDLEHQPNALPLVPPRREMDNPFIVPLGPGIAAAPGAIASLLNPQPLPQMVPAFHAVPMEGAISSSSDVPMLAPPTEQYTSAPSPSPIAASQEPAPVAEERPQTPPPMEVEREPTPLPDFVVDEAQLGALKTFLVTSTHALNVEQLEQLRATCLGVVWRHRQSWDRTELVSELADVAREFVEEVRLDEVDEMM